MTGTPRARPGQLKLQWGKLADCAPDHIACRGDGIPKTDANMLFDFISAKRHRVDFANPGNRLGIYDPSFVEELEARGYDIRTLKISIEKKINS